MHRLIRTLNLTFRQHKNRLLPVQPDPLRVLPLSNRCSQQIRSKSNVYGRASGALRSLELEFSPGSIDPAANVRNIMTGNNFRKAYQQFEWFGSDSDDDDFDDVVPADDDDVAAADDGVTNHRKFYPRKKDDGSK